jgi:hypothetical protein
VQVGFPDESQEVRVVCSSSPPMCRSPKCNHETILFMIQAFQNFEIRETPPTIRRAPTILQGLIACTGI